MIYIVSRTSAYGSENPPCEGAIKRPFDYWHTRSVSEEDFNKKFAPREGLWRSRGTEHKVLENGHISRREEDQDQWSISINSHWDIRRFVEGNGKIIIKTDDNSTAPHIEIYDTYRE